jgi:uncharacterized protein
MLRPACLVVLLTANGACSKKEESRVSPGNQWDDVALRGFALWEKPKNDRDASGARLAFEDACDHGSPLGCAGLGAVYLSGVNDRAKGIELVTKACDAKVLRACASLAAAYESGLGVERDGAKAVAISRDACNAGEDRACLLYARAMLFGDNGVAKDPTKSRDLATRACDKRVAAGCTLAGLAYSTALNNAVAAQTLLEKGCDLGDGPGCAALATQFFRGGLPGDAQGVRVSPEQGVKYATRACDLDATLGCALLAKALANGEGVPRDLVRAREVASKACEGSDALGCSVAAQLARADGREDEAKRFLQRSCALGNAHACRLTTSQ